MKWFFSVLLALFISSKGFAQPQGLPAFKIMQGDNRWFALADLPPKKPVIMIYFSPDCEHCQAFTKELLGRMKDFSKASFVFVTYLAPAEVKKFVTAYRLDRYANVHVGTEGSSYIVRFHYKVGEFPFVALHNANGAFVCSYAHTIPLDELKTRLAALP